ncbi:hypothetical protein D3C76_1469990 [compost metagenome]
MMCTAIGIRAHFFKQSELIFDQAVRQRHADPGEILMIACPFNQHRFFVQKEPFIRIEADAADAEHRLIAVKLFSFIYDSRFCLVQIW